jgi:hypothetical protein
VRVRVRAFLADNDLLQGPNLQNYAEEYQRLSPPVAAAMARHLFRGWVSARWTCWTCAVAATAPECVYVATAAALDWACWLARAGVE